MNEINRSREGVYMEITSTSSRRPVEETQLDRCRRSWPWCPRATKRSGLVFTLIESGLSGSAKRKPDAKAGLGCGWIGE
jgi:hypothetical protein